ncbi:MAG: hypothetical protein ACI8QZ_001345 [Chlamydiales bacterium]|jgi:hypothetical protein
MNRWFSIVLFVGCLCLVPSCYLLSSAPIPQWTESEVPSANEQVLREVVMVSLQRCGYPVGSGVDPGARTVATGWRESAHAFKGKGWREKATVMYRPSEDGHYQVRVRVERETNESLRPLDPAYAKWERSADHPPSADKVMQYLRSMLDSEFEVGDGSPKPFAR